MRRRFHLDLLAVTAVFAALILYGSLFPFHFQRPPDGLGPLAALAGTWTEPATRLDFVANVLLYMPLGFFGLMAIRGEMGAVRRIALVLSAGGFLSAGIECAQYFDVSRFARVHDIYTNLLGTLAGAVAGLIFGPQLRLRGALRAKLFPSVILAAWFGYRLFPFVPTINLHKYWIALRPVFFAPNLTGYGFFRYTVSWLAVCLLLEAIAGQRRSLRLFPVVAAGLILSRIPILRNVVSVEEIAGAGAGFAIWLLLIHWSERRRAMIVAGLLAAYVVMWRLEPFGFSGQAGSFSWIPFLGLTRGSLLANVQSSLEKLFYYGALLWLITAAGARLKSAAIWVGLLLLGTSLAGLYLSGRPAETTDAFMVLLIAGAVALTAPAQSRMPGARAPASGRRPLVRPPGDRAS